MGAPKHNYNTDIWQNILIIHQNRVCKQKKGNNMWEMTSN